MRAAESKPYPHQYSTRAAAFLHGLQSKAATTAERDADDYRAAA
jgi:hypothetical protein